MSVTVDVRIQIVDPTTIQFTQHLASAPSRVGVPSTTGSDQVVTRVLTAGSSMIAPGLTLPIAEFESV